MSSYCEVAERRWIQETLRRHFHDRHVHVGQPAPLAVLGSGFASKIFTVDVGDDLLVVKILPDEPLRTARKLDEQFMNETYFYSEVLPFLLGTSHADDEDSLVPNSIARNFPQFFCAYQDCFQSLIAIEDLGHLGFKLVSKFLDYAHVRLSLQELGKFHALSYIHKKNRSAAFERIAKGVKTKTRPFDKIIMVVREFLKYAVKLFVDKYPEESNKYTDKLEALHELIDKFTSLMVPTEPLAVVCHGDFNRNNLLFTYDEGGAPSSLTFIDFQLMTYSSPAIDLSLILFLSTSPEVRRLHWNDLFAAYHSSLLDMMEQSLHCPRDLLEREYSMEALMEEFKRVCVHGFFITVFFLPISMLPPAILSKLEGESNVKEATLEAIKSYVSLAVQSCSDDVNDILVELLKEFLERGYV